MIPDTIKSLKITGGQPLSGEVKVSGAKNATTKMMIASLLTDEPVTLTNAPMIGDVEITAEICQRIGAKVEFSQNKIRLHTPEITETKIKRLSRQNRLSVLALSPLLTRAGQAELPIVGGDNIGPRPVDIHLSALRQMGAKIIESKDGYNATCSGFKGAKMTLRYPSVGATENIILAAVLAEGKTEIRNAGIEPEIFDLIKLLQQMGAIIEVRADRVVVIEGVKRLHGTTYRVMPDRLEAASFAMLAVATDGEILVKDAEQHHLITFLNTIRRLGADYWVEEGGIRFKRIGQPLKAINIETDTHPGFMTDWQQPLVVLLTQADGTSHLHETVYEDRFGYTEVLNRMGADIQIVTDCLGEIECRFKGQGQPHSAIIKGPTPLHGTTIEIPDIRAGMAQVIAALVASGESKLTGVEHLLRGYEDLLPKLESIGAQFSVG